MQFQKLEEGYYWVKLGAAGRKEIAFPRNNEAGTWQIARWDVGGWWLAASDAEYDFDDFDDIVSTKLSVPSFEGVVQ